MELRLNLVLTKETPRSFKFDLQKMGPAAEFLHSSTCLYVNKDAFPDGKPPTFIKMTVDLGTGTVIQVAK